MKDNRSGLRILIAEDDPVSRRVLEASLFNWGYKSISASDGSAAWEMMQRPDAPRMAILDWMMPGLDGLELCRRIRGLPGGQSIFIILLTARCQQEDIVTGLNNGANDYLVKPFDRQELEARVRVGAQMVDLHDRLADRVRELETALAEIKTLEGLLPICGYCRKIRNEENYWQQVEHYVAAHSGLRFSHGICPNCWKSVVEPDLAKAGININAERETLNAESL